MMTLDSFKSARSVLSGVINETNLIYSPAFSAVSYTHLGDMAVVRRVKAQQVLEVDLPGSGGQQVAAPGYLGDAHQGIVHHHGQLVGVYSVGAAQNKVPAVPGQIFAVNALKPVDKSDLFIGDTDAYGRMARLGAHSLLLRAQIPAGARVDDLAVGAVGGVRRVELTPSAEAGIEQPLLFQLFQRHAVDLAALALIKFRAAGASALVPVQTQPAEVLFHPVAERALAAVWIQILQPLSLIHIWVRMPVASSAERTCAASAACGAT